MVKGNKTNLATRLGFGTILAFASPSCTKETGFERLIIPKEYIQFSTCNRWEDLNNNNKTDYPEEFIGVKDKFKKNEKLELYLHMPISGIEGRNLNVIIHNSKGEVVFADSSKISHNNLTKIYKKDFNLIPTGLGKYKAIAYIDGNLVGSHKFEIID